MARVKLSEAEVKLYAIRQKVTKPPTKASELKRALRFGPVISIVQGVIDSAIPNNNKYCAGASAIALSVPGSTQIHVDANVVRLTTGVFRFEWTTPAVLTNFCTLFDEDRAKCKPMKFQLSRPRVTVSERKLQRSSPELATMKGLLELARQGVSISSTSEAAKARPIEVEANEPTRKAPKKTRKYVQHGKSKYRCGRHSARRWHGLTLPDLP